MRVTAVKSLKNAVVQPELIKAGEIIKSGGLVAFPTETVYGLGADGFNSSAVRRIYASKGRPSDNPLILHVLNFAQYQSLVLNPPEYVKKLAKAFWPGAVTFVSLKKPHLPSWLGGHPDNETNTIAVRMPANPVTQAIIRCSDCIIAAPSANKAGKPSPTTAAHVLEDFTVGVDVDMVVDGGGCAVGLESTVVDVTGEAPMILRHGGVTAEMINSVVKSTSDNKKSTIPRSPGMKYKHYAPKAKMTVLSGDLSNISSYVSRKSNHARTGILSGKKLPNLPQCVKVLNFGDNQEEMAKNLFAHLREFDKLDVEEIYAVALEETGIGVAIMDRMIKASEGRIINV